MLVADAGFLRQVAGLAAGGFGGEADDFGGDRVAAGEGGGFCEARGGSRHAGVGFGGRREVGREVGVDRWGY